MNKVKAFSVTRSTTKQQLPNIYKNTPRRVVLGQSKSYLGQISKQISGNVQYDEMDNKNLTKQQLKLKNILKKMNDDTVQIISNFTPRPKKPQVHHRTASAILAVNEQQVQNNNKIMSRCKFEIQKLIERSDGLNMRSKQFYDSQIIKASQQILLIEEQNRNLRLQNEKRGKNIMNQQRIIQEGEIKKIQTDVYLIELRAKHLRIEDQRVNDQIKQYDRKIKQFNEKWIEAQKYLKQIQKKSKDKIAIKNNQIELTRKRQQLQSGKRKNQFYTQNSQYKYYRLLRQLEDCNKVVKETEDKTDKCFIAIQASKMIISKFESQLKIIKQKKKEREEQLNQFLSKTKLQQNKTEKQNEEMNKLDGEGGNMPSQIDIKPELGADNSQLQFQQIMNDGNKSMRKKTQQSKHSNRSRVKPTDEDHITSKRAEQRQDVKLADQI